MHIRRAFSALSLSLLGLAGLHPVPASAASQTTSPVFHPPGRYYLALGDSLAFGFQHVRFDANYPAEPPSAFNSGYVDDLANLLTMVRPNVTSVNYSCPDETSGTFLNGGCPYTASGFSLHSQYSGSQMDAAVAFLRAHPGQVGLITLDIGANDFNDLIARCGLADALCLMQGGQSVLGDYAANLARIMATLREAAPQSEIIVMQYYDAFALVQPLSEQFVGAQNAIISATAAAYRARVADAYTPFNVAPPQPQTLCALTLVCSASDIHPSDTGYEVIADQFWAASDYPKMADS